METGSLKIRQSNRLLFFGMLLFLLGLLIGLGIPAMANPRMGLSAHLEGVMNGMFLILLGLLWSRLALSPKWLGYTYGLTLYGSFANLAAVTLAAITGAGKMMPIAGGAEGTAVTEGVISFLLISLALAMVVVCASVLTGLYRSMKAQEGR